MEPTTINAIVVFVYLIATIGLGIYLSRFIKKEDDFFLAGRSLNKWIIAGTIMATNVAAIYLVGPAGAAYAGGGVSVLLIAWTGNMIAALSALFFVPRLRRLSITTVSELIETRYSVVLRLIVSLVWILYYALFAGNAIYTLSMVLDPVMPGSQNTIIICVGGAVILYCFFSGLMAAAYSSVIQSFLMIIGGLILLPLCLKHEAIGGVSGFTEKMSEQLFTFWKPADSGVWPDYKAVLMFALLGLPYWCTSQYMLQCSFAGKNVRHASRGLIIAAMITGVLTLCYIIPGMCGVPILDMEGITLGRVDAVLPTLLNTILPVGVGGLILAALVAASNSTAAALLNAAATLSENDFFRRLVPNKNSKQYLAFGRGAIVVCGLIGMLFAMQVEKLGGIIRANFKMMSFFEPPIFILVAGALFFKWVNRTGALASILAGIGLGIITGIYGVPEDTRTFLAFPVCLAALVIGSLLSRALRPVTEAEKTVANDFLSKAKGTPPEYKSPLGLAGVALAVVAFVGFVLCAIFEARLPKPGNILIIMGLMLCFTLGCYLSVPVFIPGENEGGAEGEEEKLTGIRRLLASGKSWLAIGILAVILVLVLYFL